MPSEKMSDFVRQNSTEMSFDKALSQQMVDF